MSTESKATEETVVEPTDYEIVGKIATHLGGHMTLDGNHLVIPTEAVDSIFKDKLVDVSKNQLLKAQRATHQIEGAFRQAVATRGLAALKDDAELTKVTSKVTWGNDELSASVKRPTIEDDAVSGAFVNTRRTTTDTTVFNEVQNAINAQALELFGS